MTEWELEPGDTAVLGNMNECIKRRIVDNDSDEKLYYIRRDRLDGPEKEYHKYFILEKKEETEWRWPENDEVGWEGDMKSEETKTVQLSEDEL